MIVIVIVEVEVEVVVIEVEVDLLSRKTSRIIQLFLFLYFLKSIIKHNKKTPPTLQSSKLKACC